jgi:hypothetical protein
MKYSMSLSAKIVNLPQFGRQMAVLGVLLNGQVAEKAVEEGCKVFKTKWKGTAPYFEGHYQNAIFYKVEPSKATGPFGWVYVGWLPGVPFNEQPFLYAQRLEYGRLGIPANPSARAAFESGKGEATRAMAVTYGKGLP